MQLSERHTIAVFSICLCLARVYMIYSSRGNIRVKEGPYIPSVRSTVVLSSGRVVDVQVTSILVGECDSQVAIY